MYNEKDSSAIRKIFWTRLGQYMAPVPAASGESVNWINYKTGVKGISFKINADTNGLSAAVEIYNTDTMLQHHYFDLFHKFTHGTGFLTNTAWTFNKAFTTDTGKIISIIFARLSGVNILKTEDWPAMISFVKKHLILFDEFWYEFKSAFE